MPDYRRILSYLYRYENKNKNACKGFVKAEQRDGNLKLTIQVQDQVLAEDMSFTLCFYHQKEGNWHRILLGQPVLKIGQEDTVLHYDQAALPEHFDIQKLYGLLLYYQDNLCYGSVWIGDEIPGEILDMGREEEGVISGDEAAEAATLTGSGPQDYISAVQKVEAPEKSETPEETGVPEKLKSTGKPEKSGSTDRLGRPEKSKSAGKSVNPEKSKLAHKTEALEESESIERNRTPEKSKSTIRPEKIKSDEKSDNTDKSEGSARLEISGESGAAKTSGERGYRYPEKLPKKAEKKSGLNRSRTVVTDRKTTVSNAFSGDILDETISTVSVEEEESAVEASAGLKLTEVKQDAGETCVELNMRDSDLLTAIREQAPAADDIYNSALYEGYQIVTGQLMQMGQEADRLSENQFLLKGYGRYGHLLAGKVRYDGEDRICVGVPGVYENREKYMAQLYQFPIFLSASENRVKTGRFGYWLHLLSDDV